VCHQTVGLVQGGLERVGITTASITMLPEISAKIGVPRALEVPYPLGYPLGKPNAPQLQRQILRQALGLLEREDTPVIAEFEITP
jgi:hypothetical protein